MFAFSISGAFAEEIQPIQDVPLANIPGADMPLLIATNPNAQGDADILTYDTTTDKSVSENLDSVEKVLKNAKIKISSKAVKYKTGKPAVQVKFDVNCGTELDGIEVYRSAKKNSGYKKIFDTKNSSYVNSKVTLGKTYYYKVRGYVKVDGKKYTTAWSNKACRKVKKSSVKYTKPAPLYNFEPIEAPVFLNIYFDMNGQNEGDDTMTNPVKGAKINNPPMPKIDGYTLEGWYTEKECINKWNFETDVFVEDMTLYAHWVKNA